MSVGESAREGAAAREGAPADGSAPTSGGASRIGSRRAREIAALTAAIVLAAAVTAWLGALQRDQGIARDEVVYMDVGPHYAEWWADLVTGEEGTLSREAITAHFGGEAPTANNREHPPLMKTLFGFSELLFYERLGWTSRVTASRLPGAATTGLLAAIVFLFTRRLWGAPAGIAAAALTVLIPRVAFHGQLAAFDVPIAALWMATVFAYYKALSSRAWCVVLGLVFGLALATKHNALMIPGALGAHYLFIGLRARWPAIRAAGGRARLREIGLGIVGPRPLAVACMAALGPLVLFALWPWLWLAPIDHARDWISFHLGHVHYNFEYLGRNWNAPPFPFHVPIISTLLVVPVVTLAAAVVGGGALARDAHRGESADREGAPALLLALSALVALGPFLTGQAPIFGGVKHWLAAFVTLAIAAGVGLSRAGPWAAAAAARAGWLSERGARRAGGAGTAALVVVAAVAAGAETLRAHPYALTHYSAALGGAPRGADLGMNRQYWGSAARGVLPVLAERAPEEGEAPVYTHDAAPAWRLYQRDGLVPENLADAGHEGGGVARSELAFVVHERHFARHDFMIWDDYGTVRPIHVLTLDGVPIVSVYARPGGAGEGGGE